MDDNNLADKPAPLSLDDLFAAATVEPDGGVRGVRDPVRPALGEMAALDVRSDPRSGARGVLRQLDDEVAQAIRNRELSSMPPPNVAETDHLGYVGRLNMAHLMAEEAVLAELVLLAPEPGLQSEADEPEIDETARTSTGAGTLRGC